VFSERYGQNHRVELSFISKDTRMDNIQNCDNSINMPSSQTCRCYQNTGYVKQPALPVEDTLNSKYIRQNSMCFVTVWQFRTLYMSSE
jgi:hypothetical protein